MASPSCPDSVVEVVASSARGPAPTLATRASFVGVFFAPKLARGWAAACFAFVLGLVLVFGCRLNPLLALLPPFAGDNLSRLRAPL